MWRCEPVCNSPRQDLNLYLMSIAIIKECGHMVELVACSCPSLRTRVHRKAVGEGTHLQSPHQSGGAAQVLGLPSNQAQQELPSQTTKWGATEGDTQHQPSHVCSHMHKRTHTHNTFQRILLRVDKCGLKFRNHQRVQGIREITPSHRLLF